MDESNSPQLSWRARLAKSNINILGYQTEKDYNLFVEFTYHPRPGTFKWCKTIIPRVLNPEEDIDRILGQVLTLRKELEN